MVEGEWTKLNQPNDSGIGGPKICDGTSASTSQHQPAFGRQDTAHPRVPDVCEGSRPVASIESRRTGVMRTVGPRVEARRYRCSRLYSIVSGTYVRPDIFESESQRVQPRLQRDSGKMVPIDHQMGSPATLQEMGGKRQKIPRLPGYRLPYHLSMIRFEGRPQPACATQKPNGQPDSYVPNGQRTVRLGCRLRLLSTLYCEERQYKSKLKSCQLTPSLERWFMARAAGRCPLDESQTRNVFGDVIGRRGSGTGCYVGLGFLVSENKPGRGVETAWQIVSIAESGRGAELPFDGRETFWNNIEKDPEPWLPCGFCCSSFARNTRFIHCSFPRHTVLCCIFPPCFLRILHILHTGSGYLIVSRIVGDRKL
ncbi:hypothetical protein B0T20DRAFT_471438 [Sordaria brevicollis]|uniref:Uncharacterized protein n=1 Tax=Sordaria brevicollis TaxID=83679 RepID=A0AAE0PAY9_SORBR|nr:hypothetical protein B0T20DRAFT_471438 [Sordaria brevicollis]